MNRKGAEILAALSMFGVPALPRARSPRPGRDGESPEVGERKRIAALRKRQRKAGRVEEEELVETIVAAALLINGEVFTRPQPARHSDLIRAWREENPGERPASRDPHYDQGFVTSEGRWLRRAPAAILAFRSGQIQRDKRALFSEDLW